MFVLMESSPISIHYKALKKYFLGKMKTFMLILIKLPHHSLLFWLGFFSPFEKSWAQCNDFTSHSCHIETKGGAECVNRYW